MSEITHEFAAKLIKKMIPISFRDYFLPILLIKTQFCIKKCFCVNEKKGTKMIPFYIVYYRLMIVATTYF